jgi:Rrf2 family protein
MLSARFRQTVRVRISARADYAVRAMAELAAAGTDARLKAEALAEAQGIPPKFLQNILADLRKAGIVTAVRGQDGGFTLARRAAAVTLADVIRAVEGPLASVQEQRPEDVEYDGAAEPLRTVWVALRANMRAVLESVTLADLVADRLPASVRRLADRPDAWVRR